MIADMLDVALAIGRIAVPRLLLNLRNVPEDEIAEVRSMMDEHGLEWYVTPPGPFGITAGGIWLKNSDDYARARALMDDYQEGRANRGRVAGGPPAG